MLRLRAVPLAKGHVIAGRYRLDGLLGRGGMGEVWAATHLVTERRVAVKFVETSLRLTDRLRERLFREARAASRAQHPGVIEIVDALTVDDDVPVLVMERLDGETLSARLRREGALPLPEAADILLQIVSAVGAAHERGIVHRDLKPDNVFLCLGGDEPTVKVLDFGIAKLAVPGAPASSGLTSVGQILGTPAYMAPEQCRSERDLDHRVDIWALGIMTYELLSGERPVEGDNLGEVVEWLLTEGVPPLRERVPDAPFDIAVMARRMVERDPAARPADLREVAAVLRRHTRRTVPDFGPAGTSVSSETLDPEPAFQGVADTERAPSLAPAEHSVRRGASRRPRLLAGAAVLLVVAGLSWAGLSGRGLGTASRPAASLSVTNVTRADARPGAAAPAPAPPAAIATAIHVGGGPEPSDALAPRPVSSTASATPPARPSPAGRSARAASAASTSAHPTPSPPTMPVTAPAGSVAPTPAPRGPSVQGWD